MKKVTVFLSVVFFVLCASNVMAATAAKAEQAAPVAQASNYVNAVPTATPEMTYDNVISANSWVYLMALFNLGYERSIFPAFSIRVRGFYWGIAVSDWHFYDVGADLFIHPAGKGLAGFYLGPRFDVWMASTSTGTGSLYWLGGQVGYRWIYESGFSMALALGAQLNISSSTTSSSGTTIGDPPLKGLTLPAVDFDLGYAF